MIIIILEVLAFLIAIMWIVCVMYIITKGRIFKWFYHDILEWHLPNEEEGFDGCSFHSTCKLCGKEIMQDSQGNWF